MNSKSVRSVFSNTQVSGVDWRVDKTMCAKYLVENKLSTFDTYHQNNNSRRPYSTNSMTVCSKRPVVYANSYSPQIIYLT